MQLARQAARRADQCRVVRPRPLHSADDLCIGGQGDIGRCRGTIGGFQPFDLAVGGNPCPAGIERMTAKTRAQRVQADLRIGNQRQALMLGGIESLDVESDDLHVFIAKQRPGAGGEILKARADGEHDIGLTRDQIGGGRTGDADRAHILRVAMRQRRLAGLGLDDGHAMFLCEGRQCLARLRIKDAAAGDDDGFFRGLQGGDCCRQFVRIRLRTTDRPDLFGKEAFRIVIGLGLNILAERECHRTAIGRIGQDLHGAAQCWNDLLGAGDAVEVARHRTEAVIGGHRAIAEILDLLQNRIRAAIGEDVAGKEQDGQTVDMGERR